MANESDANVAAKDGVTQEPFIDWHAEHNVQPIVTQPSLRVYGRYDTGDRCGGVRLQEKVPKDFNPTILALDLVDSDGPGGIVEVEARFDADPGQYGDVVVRDAEGNSITITVEEIQ